MKARIYKPGKSVMQSGRGKLDKWVLEYEPESPRRPESLMGWTASADTLNQVRLRFPTLDEAVAFAQKRQLDYTITGPHERKVRPRNYGDNFRYQPEEGRKA